jgi:hypothetical protein
MMTSHNICSRCTKKFDLKNGRKISYAQNIFYMCNDCLPSTKNCKSLIYPFKWDYFCSPCEWFGYVDETLYLDDRNVCPICKNTELEMNDEKS